MNRYVGIALLFLTLFGVSCVKEDKDVEQCPVDLRLLYDWSLANSVQPTDSLITIMPDGSDTIQETDNVGTKLRLPAGAYSFVAIEPSHNVRLRHDTIFVNKDLSNYAVDPDSVSAGKKTVTLAPTGTPVIHYVPMRYQTRPLIIKVNFIGLGIATLTDVEGELSGVAISRKVEYGFPPMDGFPDHNAIEAGSKFYDSFVYTGVGAPLVSQFRGVERLLGIDDSSTQILSLVLTFTGGGRNMTVDVSSYLANFHTNNVTQPFVIELTISISANFTFSVTDWRSGSTSDLNAH